MRGRNAYLFVCLPASFLVCLFACLPASFLVCLFACLPASFLVCLFACLPASFLVCLFACLPASFLVCLFACLSASFLVCLFACLPVSVLVCSLACLLLLPDLTCSPRLDGQVVSCPPREQKIWGSISAFRGGVILMTYKSVHGWPPCQAPGVAGQRLEPGAYANHCKAEGQSDERLLTGWEASRERNDLPSVLP